MKSFLTEKGLVRQHLDSFNELIDYGLQEIINEVGKIEIETPDNPCEVRLGKIEVGSPRIAEADGSEHPIYPMEARLRNLTYAAPLQLEMTSVINGRERQTENVYIGDLPVMLKSKLCPLSQMTPEELVEIGEDPRDLGGYFIINGSERVIVALEDLTPNRVLIDVDQSSGRFVYRAKVFSSTVGFRARVEVTLKPTGVIYVSIPGVPIGVPLIVLMRALGLNSDKEIAEIISLDREVQDELYASFEDAEGVNTPEEAILYIGNRIAHGQIMEYRLQKAQSILDKNFLPHIGRTKEARFDKAVFLGEMVSRVIELKLGRRKPDDKDHYANKRLKLAGSLLADLFRIAFRNLCRDIKYQLERMNVRRRELSISAAVRPGIITERLQHAFATGNWGRGKVGVTQLLDRTNYLSTLSHLRRLQSPLSRSQPNFEARDLHPTHWGRLCPNETPEGSNCGLVKNISLAACTSVYINPDEIKHILYYLGVVPYKESSNLQKISGTKVFLNGCLIGFCEDPINLVTAFRRMRRAGRIDYGVNIMYLESEGGKKEVYVNSDSGRVQRPLIVVENGKPKLTLEHMLKIKSGELTCNSLAKMGVIEYLDADEEENAYIALSVKDLTPEHTHLEIAPYAILGVCASVVPYAEYNQSPRNSYESAMAKQALGVYATNYFNRVDSRSHILHYPQVPLVKTKPSEIVGYSSHPSGQNCVVAVLSFEGYNMEDALIFNKAAIERGLLHSTSYRIYEAECRQYLGGLKDRFEIPEPGTRGYRGEQCYRLLEEDGVIRVESSVSGNDVLIGRTSPPRFLEEYKEFEVKGPNRRDSSVSIRPFETGTVDDVFVTESAQGSKLVKVRVRTRRVPELGDKFASRHGQKGVIGLIVPQEDMPYTEIGLVPDIIINPHAIPSRMTIGQFVESIAGKVAALQGVAVDGTPFVNDNQEYLRKLLLHLGFQHSGKEVLYNGITGEKYEANIFIGIVYYQKLHHMVSDKMHARARGQVQMLTRQPTEGRARGGGLRFGEMERDCLIAYGAASLLKDRLLEESDKTMVYVCQNCGFLAHYDYRQRKYVCKLCDEKAIISPVAISYAFKLLLQELMSLGIAPRLKLKERA